jgi:hypothetical protein
MPESIIQRAFASGELAPVLHARADTAKYTQGLRTCRNFMVRREGGVSNRAGFKFVDPCKTDDFGTRLMRYVGSIAGESFLIEMGNGYFRFYQDGAAVTVTGAPAWSGATAYEIGDLVSRVGVTYYCVAAHTNHQPPDAAWWHPLAAGNGYEIPTPYPLDELPDWNQSGNVITLTHPAHQPYELIFIDDTHWTLTPVNTAPTLGAPQNVVGTPGAAGALTYKYVVTAVATDTYEETNPSTAATIASCALPTQAAPNSLTWDVLVGAAEYNVYADPYGNGVYGFVGVAASNSFKDAGVTPDFMLSPPTANVLFQTTGNYPSHSAQYQQRRFFANTDLAPDAFWGSRIGFRSNFGSSSPLQDDDAVTFRLAGNNQHPIRHMAALAAGLILLTDGGEWTVTGGSGPKSPITPSSIDALQETYVGISAEARPAVVGNAILYVQARGSILRDLQFDQAVEGLAGRDLTIFATHLFERKTIVALDYQQVPHSIIWCVRSDGVLLGLTYIPEQDIWGWHRHDTIGGSFEDCCVVPEAEEDVLYVIVARDIGGNVERYIERLERRDLLEGFIHASSFFVDSGLSYSGPPADVFTGLDHLNGEVVAVYADGQALTGPFTVAGGTVTLAEEYSNVHIGLPITAEIETLDLDVQGSDIRDKAKRVPAVTLLVEQSSQKFSAGPDDASLRPFTPETWQGTADTNTGQLEITLTSRFDHAGRVLIRQTDPLPTTILGVIPSVEVGG